MMFVIIIVVVVVVVAVVFVVVVGFIRTTVYNSPFLSMYLSRSHLVTS